MRPLVAVTVITLAIVNWSYLSCVSNERRYLRDSLMQWCDVVSRTRFTAFGKLVFATCHRSATYFVIAFKCSSLHNSACVFTCCFVACHYSVLCISFLNSHWAPGNAFTRVPYSRVRTSQPLLRAQIPMHLLSWWQFSWYLRCFDCC